MKTLARVLWAALAAVLVLTLLVAPVQGQAWQWLRTVPLEQPLHLANDGLGHIFVADARGNLNRYDSLGNAQLHYSPPQMAEISLLDARQTARIFAFYREPQNIALFNRFLGPLESYSLAALPYGFVRLAAPAADNQLWLYDDTALAIAKYDKQFGRETLRIPLDMLLPQAAIDLTYMAEYQNLLFVADRTEGILVFDNMGNYRWRMANAAAPFGFLGEEIYWPSGQGLHLAPIYGNAPPRLLAWPQGLAQKVRSVILQNGRAYLLTDSALIIYGLKTP